MSNELDKLHVWFTVNRLSLNISKTNYILFGRRRCIADAVSITMDKSPISRVKVTKFLGVNIDEQLTWKLSSQNCRKPLALFIELAIF